MSNLDFLILATPRSGSAWLANLLTHGECFCYHDPMAGGPLSRLERQAPITGAIDTGAWNWPKQLPRVPKLYALTREPRRVSRSLRTLYLPDDPDFELFREVTRDLITFEYERLFNVAYLAEVWRTVVGPATFHVERAKQLLHVNIQRDIPALIDQVRTTYAGV